MKLAAAFLALGMSATAAHAAIITQTLYGTVDDGTYSGVAPTGTSYVPGNHVTLTYSFDTTTDMFTSFNIGGYSAPAGATTIYSPPLNATSYIYAGEKLIDGSGNLLALLQVNFYEVTPPYPLPSSANIGAFLANPVYSTDLSSGSPSYFSVLLQDANGNVTTSFGAVLPEPMTITLLAAGVAGLRLARRRPN